MTDWNKLKVVDLKNELKSRGLPQGGLKLDLVNRLTAAENEATGGYESEATIQDEATKDAAASTSPETIEPTHQSPPFEAAEPLSDPIASESPSAAPVQLSPEVTHHSSALKPASHQEPLPTASAPTIETSQPSLPAQDSQSSLPPIDPIEFVEDRQKRKRRSLTPPPSVTDVARKRLRQSDDLQEVITTEEDVAWVEKHNAVDAGAINAEAKEVASSGGVEYGPTIVDASIAGVEVEHASIPKEEHTDDYSVRSKDPLYKDIFHHQESQPTSNMDVDIEQDRNISPAIHPATAALYIRDLMRPLNTVSFRQYLTALATPPGLSPDPAVLVGFYLDPIRTHGFFSFTSVSAASRVRSAIHDRVWPDEANRKPLWADFIPFEKAQEWSDQEQSFNGNGRSPMMKWEVYYHIDQDGKVTAVLQEATNRPMSQHVRKLSVQGPLPVHPDRLALVAGAVPSPSYAPQNYRGFEHVPSGPRISHDREQRAAQNLSALDELFNSTGAKPTLYWQPVDKSLANARLDQMESMITKDVSRHTGGDINRYTFEDGDKFVDRGPEIFAGIRPPRRENRGQFPARGRGRGGYGGYGGPRGRGGYGGYDRGHDRGYDRNYDSYRSGMSPPDPRDRRY